MNIDNCWRSPANTNHPPGYRLVCTYTSLGYMIPYTDKECKNLDLKTAKPPPDSPNAPDPFHVGGPEWQPTTDADADTSSDSEDGQDVEEPADADADGNTDADADADADSLTDGDTGTEVVEKEDPDQESSDGRTLSSMSRRLLEPTTRCFPARQRRPADTLHYVVESCYLGPEVSVTCKLAFQ